MLISYRARLCYLAMPKTGSTAIEHRLRPECNIILQGNAHTKHINVREYRQFLQPALEHLNAPDLELCLIVRAPVDWFGSWYKYRQRNVEEPRFSTKGIDFETFVQALLQTGKRPEYTHYIGTQHEFAQDADERVTVPHLFRHDNMPALHDFLQDRFGKTLEFEQLNVSPKGDLKLSAASRAALEAKYAKDFELYERIG